MLNEPYSEYYDKSFSMYFDSLEIALCSTAVFTSPKTAPKGLTAQVFAEKPVKFSLG